MKTVLAIFLCCAAFTVQAAGSSEIRFQPGRHTAIVTGHIKGRDFLDYRIRAAAGQRLHLALKGGLNATQFNVLPPDSEGAAMFIDGSKEREFSGLLPADGEYRVRVYLVRAVARRGVESSFTLTAALTGKALPPLPAVQDARVPGTPYHATATVSCALTYTATRQCETGVIRRSHDGSATVELRWDVQGMRRILFVQGIPVAADALDPPTYTRSERGYLIRLGDSESFEIPDPLIFGG